MLFRDEALATGERSPSLARRPATRSPGREKKATSAGRTKPATRSVGREKTVQVVQTTPKSIRQRRGRARAEGFAHLESHIKTIDAIEKLTTKLTIDVAEKKVSASPSKFGFGGVAELSKASSWKVSKIHREGGCLIFHTRKVNPDVSIGYVISYGLLKR